MDDYRPQSRDTDPAVEAVLLEGLRRLSSVEKAAQISAMFRAGERLSIAGLRERYPEADERELRFRAGALRLGNEVMKRVFGWDMDEKGH